jgi:hypothetical protein
MESDMNTTSLSERALLASLNIRRWAAARTDKRISTEVAASHAVSEKRAGKYRKNAIDITAPSFEAVISASSELRNKHYFYTLPWSQDGARILPAAAYDDYAEQMRRLRAAFDRAVVAFVEDFPRLKAAAKRELNGMYNEADYPTNIAAKFGVDLRYMPLPNGEDFRASLPAPAVAEIKQDIEAELQQTTQLAMREPYQRLYNHISRMVERLSDSKAVFRDTLVTGLAELCTILPALNLTGDTQLDELRKRAERMIANVDPQELRDHPSLRSTVARQAADIQHIMADFMGAAPSEGA